MKSDPVITAYKALEQNLETIEGCRKAIEDILEENDRLDLLEELEHAQKIHPTLVSDLKNAARDSGEDLISLGEDIEIKVSTPRAKVVQDPNTFVETAKRNGDFEVLLQAGVIKTSVDARQLERADSRLQARYAEFVSEQAGTPRVMLPKTIKDV